MRNKLKYDKDQLTFVEEKSSFKDYLKKFLWFLVASLGLALLYYVIFAFFFNTDEERRLIRENKAIEEEYADLESKINRLENVVGNLRSRDDEIYREIFNAEPPHFLDTTQDSLFVSEGDTTFGRKIIHYTADMLKELEKRSENNSEIFSSIQSTLSIDSIAFQSIPSILPVNDFSIVQTGATTGRKVHPFYKTVVMHTGLDIITTVGTEVRATADGVVKLINSEKGKGKQVEINHGNGYVTTYSHLGDFLVRNGKKVKQGAIIGRVGTSGTTFAPHLHYEVLMNGEYQNPVNYFFAELGPHTYKEMMIIAVNTGQSLD